MATTSGSSGFHVTRWFQLFCLSVGCVLAMEAAAFRCGSDLVREGDYDFEVARKCGAPDYIRTIGYRLHKPTHHHLVLERWIYETSANAVYILIFEAGRLISIDWDRAP